MSYYVLNCICKTQLSVQWSLYIQILSAILFQHSVLLHKFTKRFVVVQPAAHYCSYDNCCMHVPVVCAMLRYATQRFFKRYVAELFFMVLQAAVNMRKSPFTKLPQTAQSVAIHAKRRPFQ